MLKLSDLDGVVFDGLREIKSGDTAEFSDDGHTWYREQFFAEIPSRYVKIQSFGRGPDGDLLSIANNEVRRWNFIRSVRRCLKCDFVPESSHKYCPQCGTKLGA